MSSQQLLRRLASIFSSIFPTIINQNSLIMNSMEALQQTVIKLQSHVQCLLIRVSSCEKFIEKLLKTVGEGSQQKSNRSINDHRNNQSSQVSNEQKNPPSTSLKDFLLYPSCKDIRSKQLDTNSFTLIKNAIMINSHEIETMEAQIKQQRRRSENRLQKLQQAVQILTNVVSIIDAKQNSHIRNQSIGKSLHTPTKRKKPTSATYRTLLSGN